ncbi:hypothetical protein ACHMZP_32245 [Rhodococcus baikonurensis]|uniref:hypothetical protein n=1 Tax=Rhodococcus erythropolis group TaxID=2840174 RepID=UPI0015524152|nr:hypothetical protein [Rhodococcus erythropolis]PBI86880.1 hypothetical protein BKP42_63300 [Rhodococcus erythropolis]
MSKPKTGIIAVHPHRWLSAPTVGVDMRISWVESLERECKNWQVFIDAAVAELRDDDR